MKSRTSKKKNQFDHFFKNKISYTISNSNSTIFKVSRPVRASNSKYNQGKKEVKSKIKKFHPFYENFT